MVQKIGSVWSKSLRNTQTLFVQFTSGSEKQVRVAITVCVFFKKVNCTGNYMYIVHNELELGESTPTHLQSHAELGNSN